MLNVMCVACAEAALLLGNLWRDGGAAVVAEVRFFFSGYSYCTELQNTCSACLCVCTNARNIRGFL